MNIHYKLLEVNDTQFLIEIGYDNEEKQHKVMIFFYLNNNSYFSQEPMKNEVEAREFFDEIDHWFCAALYSETIASLN